MSAGAIHDSGTFLSNTEAIRSLIETIITTTSTPIWMAVAFWGDGAQTLFRDDRQFKVICNLSTGGTNPRTIRAIASRHEVRHSSTLHAKVIIGSEKALVGSANISNHALALNGDSPTCWQEAVIVVPSQTSSYDAAKVWLDSLWRSALPVDEAVLSVAEQLFERRRLDLPTDTAPKKSPESNERLRSLLFSVDEIKERNRIRMASKLLNDAFKKHVEELNTNNIRIPAFAANLLWTLAGNEISTRIDNCPMFTLPDQVIYRATEPSIQPKESLIKLEQLLKGLIGDDDVPDSIRCLAKRWLERPKSDRDIGVHPTSGL